MNPGLKIAVGVFVALFTMSFVVVYDVYIKDKIDSVEVVTVKAGEQIERNEPITAAKLSVELREKSSLIDGVITADKMKNIIGVESAQLIVGNSMLSEEMLNRDKLIPNKGESEAIRPIIADWIYATPGSLRRKDKVNIYVVKELDEDSGQGVVVVSGDDEPQKSEPDMIGPILEDVRVLYAKDQSNKEVVGDSTGPDERLNGTSQIAEIEVILNEEDFAKMTDYVIGKGYKLYITYN